MPSRRASSGRSPAPKPKQEVPLPLAIGVGVVVLVCAAGVYKSLNPAAPPTPTPPPPATKLLVEFVDQETYLGVRVTLEGKELLNDVGKGNRTLERSEPFPEREGAYAVELSGPDGPLKSSLRVARVPAGIRLGVQPAEISTIRLYVDGRGAEGKLRVGGLTLPPASKLHKRIVEVPPPKTAAGRELALGETSIGSLPAEGRPYDRYIVDAAGGHTYRLQEVLYAGKGLRAPHEAGRATYSGARIYRIPEPEALDTDLMIHFKIHFLEPAPESVSVYSQTVNTRTKGIKHLQILSD